MKITDFDSSAAVMSLNWQIRLRRHRQIAFNLILLLLSFLEGNMAEYSKEIQHRQLMRRPSSCPYPSAVFFFFFHPLTHAGPRCERAKVRGVTLSQRGHSLLPPPVSCMVFIKPEVSMQVHRSPKAGFCFTQYRGRDNCSPFILTLLFPRKQGNGRPRSFSGRPSARTDINPLFTFTHAAVEMVASLCIMLC